MRTAAKPTIFRAIFGLVQPSGYAQIDSVLASLAQMGFDPQEIGSALALMALIGDIDADLKSKTLIWIGPSPKEGVN